MGGVGSGTGAVVSVDRMWDCKAATVTINDEPLGKVRVLWRDGALRCFNAIGCVLDIQSEKPKRKPWHIRKWVANTEHGEIIIKEKCWTCGGWHKIAGIDAGSLWQSGR